MRRRLPTVACAIAIGLLLLLDTPRGSAAPTPEPDVASLVAEACELLRAHAEVRAHFPGAVDLCAPDAPAARACQTRAAPACTRDALCEVHTTFVCDRSPCPPGKPIRSTCVAGRIERLAPGIVRYPLCIRTGGSWEPLLPASPHAPWRGTCSCMGPSANAIVFTRDGYSAKGLPRPLRYFVQGRGCVAEDTLCREQQGVWVARVPRQPWEPPRCEIDGREVLWRYRLRVGFAE